MIMVIGGRCQGKSSFAREHFESRIQEDKKIEKDGEIQKDHLENLKTDLWTDGETATWEEFLASAWSRNFHLLVRRILKKDETLGLPDEQEKGVFEIMPTGHIHCRSSPYSGHR